MVNRVNNTAPSSPAIYETPVEHSGPRLLSLDAFRGATILLMVLVNNGGGPQSFGPLKHSLWNGWTPTDVVFPSFLWIVGVAMVFALSKRAAAGVPRPTLFLQILRRALILFALGLIVYAFPHFDLSSQRILGVLQRIAICYLVAGTIFLTTSVRGQVLLVIGLLASYWLMMALVPVPGCGSGQLTVECNSAHYIDTLVLGQHNYRFTKTWDPEGVVSTLPAIATTLLGMFAAYVLRRTTTLENRTSWLFVMGCLLLTAGLVLDPLLPINKSLWTCSFALFMAGLDCLLLANFIFFIEGQGWRSTAEALAVAGRNPISVYMVSELLAETLGAIHLQSGASLQRWIYTTLFGSWLQPELASLGYALAFTVLMYLVSLLMHRRRWIVKV